ncbi:hypothetical protein FF098_004640 [Parvularcula flava]|nr:hypothetical protein [Aquisalinus luteolus]NHK27187.1 hypothetical protein [Aquisalinus luteolus]
MSDLAGTDIIYPERGRVHELSGMSADMVALLAAGEGQKLLCGPPGWIASIHPEGLSLYADPAQFLQISCPLKADALWSTETALRSGSVDSVIAWFDSTPDLTSFRRLQLAAREGHSLGLLIVARPAVSSAAETRWHCLPARPENNDSTLIHLSLHKNKKGTIGSWNLHVKRAKSHLDLDAAPAGEPRRPDRHTGR